MVGIPVNALTGAYADLPVSGRTRYVPKTVQTAREFQESPVSACPSQLPRWVREYVEQVP